MTATEAKRIYLKDLPKYEAKGWRPSLRDGKIQVLATPTGVQTYAWRVVTNDIPA